MQLVVAIVFKFNARADEKLDKIAISSSCDLCNLSSDAIIAVGLDVVAKSKIGHCECLEELDRECTINLPFCMRFKRMGQMCLAVYLVQKCIIALAISTRDFDFANMSAIRLFAHISSINLLHEVIFDMWALVHKELIHFEASVKVRSAIDIAENLHQFKISLSHDDLQRLYRALSAPRHVKRRDIFVVMNDSPEQKLVICQHRTNHVAGITLEAAVKLGFIGIIKLFNFFLDDLCIWVPFTDFEHSWLFGRFACFLRLALRPLVWFTFRLYLDFHFLTHIRTDFFRFTSFRAWLDVSQLLRWLSLFANKRWTSRFGFNERRSLSSGSCLLRLLVLSHDSDYLARLFNFSFRFATLTRPRRFRFRIDYTELLLNFINCL